MKAAMITYNRGLWVLGCEAGGVPTRRHCATLATLDTCGPGRPDRVCCPGCDDMTHRRCAVFRPYATICLSWLRLERRSFK